MARILLLVHRLPYPPNKGDKVRSFHLLKHLAERHEVYLGTFVDDPDDRVHISRVKSFCKDLFVAPLAPRSARLASLAGLFTGEALTLRYYRDAGLQNWVRQLMAQEVIDTIVVFSSSMAQYAEGYPRVPMLIDFVDVDSAKWSDYAPQHRWPMSWLYRREGRMLLAYERAQAVKADRSFLVTEKETALFFQLAPECATRVEPLGNGVDADFFSPDAARTTPFAPDEQAIVFTGAMDYWPNVDAVKWFCADALPTLLARWPRLRFYIVGRSPTAAVRALASSAVEVTGTVDDVRPYLQHASVVVAPLRLARGIQNKILEAMAMGKAVVASSECVSALDARVGEELLAASSAEELVAQVDRLLHTPAVAQSLGSAARQRVIDTYSWAARLAALDAYLPSPAVVAPASTRAEAQEALA